MKLDYFSVNNNCILAQFFKKDKKKVEICTFPSTVRATKLVRRCTNLKINILVTKPSSLFSSNKIFLKMASVSRLFTRMFQRRSFATASASGLAAEMLAEEVHAAGL